MAMDGITLSVIRKRLDFLVSGKIEKIYQPSKTELILSIKQGKAYKLLISASPDRARIQLSEQSFENPKVPPMFCMLMRKHLQGGIIRAFRQDGLERVIYIDIESIDELGDRVLFTLCCEMMGRYSNIILVKPDGKIVDSIKRIDPASDAERLVLPGLQYEKIPPSGKAVFTEISSEDLREIIPKMNPNNPLSRELVNTFEGVSPLIAREWEFYTAKGNDIRAGELDENLIDRLVFIIRDTAEKLKNKDFVYTILKTPKGVMKEFSIFKILQYGNLMVHVEYNDLFEMLDDYYINKDKSAILRQRADDLFKILLNNQERISRKISNQEADLQNCAKKDKFKEKADLISSYIYMIKKGDREIEVPNFYKSDSPMVKISLDPMLSPAENAQKFYKKYRKSVTAEKVLKKEIEKGKSELEYLDTVLDALSRAESESDISQLRIELAETGYIKKTSNINKKAKSLPPIEYTSSDGFKIAVGRNNRQNDNLTMKIAKKSDIWLHTQKIPGSHVIIFTEGREVPDRTLAEAASIAAWHSKAQNSDHVPVDYCFVKYVKKPPNSKPGMVIFSEYKTIFATPMENGKS